jgi:hypothetical protein
MILKTFHSYKFYKSAHKSTIKEHLFTSGHKSPSHIHDMGVGTASAIIKSQHKFQCFFVAKLNNLVTCFFHKMNKKENIVILRDLFHLFLKKNKNNHI